MISFATLVSFNATVFVEKKQQQFKNINGKMNTTEKCS